VNIPKRRRLVGGQAHQPYHTNFKVPSMATIEEVEDNTVSLGSFASDIQTIDKQIWDTIDK